MVTLFLIYAIVSGVASFRGYKSPLFGAAGVIVYYCFQFPAAALMPESSEYVQLIVAAVAAVACLSLWVLLMPSRDPRAEPKQSPVPYALLGSLALLASCGVGGMGFQVMSQGGGSVVLLTALLLLTGSLACFRLHKQQTQLTATELLQRDTRPPVLFLRSFRSDAMRMKSWGAGLLPMYPEWMGKSFEEFLAPAMNKIGPFVGLGDPEDYLPTLGAGKVYQRDDSWQEAVLDLLRRSKLVILMEGDTPGLSWELSQVRQRCSPRSIFLITPSRDFPRTGWYTFAGLLQEAGFEISKVDVGPGAVVGFDDSFRPFLICRYATSAQHFNAAILDWHAPGAGGAKPIADWLAPANVVAMLPPHRVAEESSPPATTKNLPRSPDRRDGLQLLGWMLGMAALMGGVYWLFF